jgi:hypothetical protein
MKLTVFVKNPFPEMMVHWQVQLPEAVSRELTSAANGIGVTLHFPRDQDVLCLVCSRRFA